MKIVAHYPHARRMMLNVSETEYRVIQRIDEIKRENPTDLYVFLKEGSLDLSPRQKAVGKFRIWAAKFLTWRRPAWMRKPAYPKTSNQ